MWLRREKTSAQKEYSYTRSRLRFNQDMSFIRQSLLLSLALFALMVSHRAVTAQTQPNAASQNGDGSNESTGAEQLFVLANQARAVAGVGRLSWDPALSEAALQHCQLMAKEGPIAHQYGGEPNISTRAAQAGAHFSLLEENVAVGPTAAAIHDEWMHSAGHRANLLNPNVNRLGVAVVEAHGVLYAVEDFSQAEPVLSQSQLEIVIARLVGVRGITILADTSAARAYCAGSKLPAGARQPSFLMTWQGTDLTKLPKPLADRLASGQFHQAEVGSCAPQGATGSFTLYRVAVTLY
jgi:uncharacterized protein YkwD